MVCLNGLKDILCEPCSHTQEVLAMCLECLHYIRVSLPLQTLETCKSPVCDFHFSKEADFTVLLSTVIFALQRVTYLVKLECFEMF